jgi:hypothetical protein
MQRRIEKSFTGQVSFNLFTGECELVDAKVFDHLKILWEHLFFS